MRNLESEPIPTGDPGSWISSADYPSALRTKGVSGIVRFRLDVDAAGKPSNCTVLAAFSDVAFKKVTCDKLMRKAQFQPAKDAAGTAVPSYWVSSVVWIS